MKIAIIGAGAIGVTTAHALNKAGCEVHVFELGGSAAQGSSFSHSGLLGASSVSPIFTSDYASLWAQAFAGQAKHLHWQKNVASAAYLHSFKAMWLNRESEYQSTEIALKDLARYSSELVDDFLSETSLNFEQSSGVLSLFTKQADLLVATQRVELANRNIFTDADKIKVLNNIDTYIKEPFLSKENNLLGSIFYPNEKYGNCALFTKQLKLLNQTDGIQYYLNCKITQLENIGSRWRLLSKKENLLSKLTNDVNVSSIDRTDQTNHSAPSILIQAIQSKQNNPSENVLQKTLYDAVVLATGSETLQLLNGLNINYPVLKTHSYTVTAPVSSGIDCPSTVVVDVESHNSMVPIGNRVRVSGQIQIDGGTKGNKKAYQALNSTIQKWYPFASKVSEASYDISTNCVAVDSRPIVGACHLQGLFLNFAHGSHSWSLALGCAQALSDEILKSKNRFNLDAFLPQRFAK